MKRSFLFLLIILFSTHYFSASATHIKAGEITVTNDGNSSNFIVTLSLYLDSTSVVGTPQGDAVASLWEDVANIDFGDGNGPIPIPLSKRESIGNNTFKQTYIHRIIYPSQAGEYVISYFKTNRNDYVVNISLLSAPVDSDKIPFYVETKFTMVPSLGFVSTPILTLPPVDNATPGQIFTHNPGTLSQMPGDSISYELTVPKQTRNRFVDVYMDPDDPAFGGVSVNGTPSTFTLNPTTGDLVWDTPPDYFPPGIDYARYNIAIKIQQWKKLPDGSYMAWSYVIRDMQIEVKKRDNKRPELIIPNDTCFAISPGQPLIDTVYVSDPDILPTRQKIVFDASSEVFSLGAVLNRTPGTTHYILDNPDKVLFSWQPDCEDIRDIPYNVYFKVSDLVAENIRLSNYKTWQVRVYGEKPQNISINYKKEGFQLNWQKYYCSNADSIIIYRKDCNTEITPKDPCEPLTFLDQGYVKVGSASGKDSTFFDTTNIHPGSSYCYILIARFLGLNGNVEFIKGYSQPSDEICGNALKENIIFTKASIEKTDSLNGHVFIQWKTFIDTLSSASFQYKLYRGFGYEGGELTEIFSSLKLTDTLFIDSIPPLNTRDTMYHYRLDLYKDGELYTQTDIPSTVYLKTTSGNKSAALSWEYNVPWKNNQLKHYVFRKEQNDSVFSKIEEIYASEFDGRMEDKTVENRKTYCYYIETRAYYCIDTISDTLINKSQIACVTPLDSLPPCPPVLTLADENCNLPTTEKVIKPYKNFLKWETDTTLECNKDLNGFNLYFAPREEEDFVFLKSFDKNTRNFVHEDTSSQAGCYYVTAFDIQGIESEPSNIECNDNCYYYELPNLLTPNQADGFNQKFVPYPFPKGVEDVELFVYNRWGGLVHHQKNDFNINWDPSFSKLADGVYYYVAKLKLERRLKLKDEEKELKGWLRIISNNTPTDKQ